MHETIQKMARAFAKQREQRRRAFAGFTALAILVSISTTYLLVRPANTMAVDYYCGYEAHIHTEECFERVLICGYETEDNTVSGGGGVEWLPPEFDLPEVIPPVEGEIPVEGELPEVLPPAEGEIPVEGELPEVIPPAEGEIPVEGELPEVTPPAEEPPVVEVPEVKEPETAETPAEPDVPAVEETPAEEPEEEAEAPAESETLTASSIQYDEAPADSGSSEDSAPADSGSDEPAPAPKEESKPAEAPKTEEPKEEPKAEEPSAPAETPSEEPEAPAGSEEPAEGEDPAEEPTEGEPSVEGEEPEIPSDESSEPEGHVHTEECYEYILICELPEHIHTELCLPQSMVQLLPEGAELPAGYDNEYSFVDTDDGFAVVVYAPDGALPEDVELVAELLEEGSDAYITAAQALEAMAEETVPVYIGGVMPESALEEAAAAADPDVEYIEEPEIFEEELTQPEEPAAPVEGEIFGEIPADPRVTEPEAPAEEPAEPEVPAEPPVEEPAEEPAPEEPAEEPEEEPAEGETLTASSIQYDEIPAEEPVIEEEIPAEEPVIEEEIPVEEPVIEEEILTEEPVIEEELSAEEPTPEEIFGEDFIPYRDEVADEGFLALDIRFELYGEEVEPVMPVFVCINVKALLPEDVDPASVVIVHLKEEGEEEISAEEDDMVSLMGEISEGEPAELVVSGPVVEVVADSTEDTGILETVSSEDYAALDVTSFFAVDSFSTFTIQWSNSNNRATVHYVDMNGTEIQGSRTTPVDRNAGDWVNLSDYNTLDASIAGKYTYQYAKIDNYSTGTTVSQIRYNWSYDYWSNGWFYYTPDNESEAVRWNSNNKDVYLVYQAVGQPITAYLIDTEGNFTIDGNDPVTLNIHQGTEADLGTVQTMSAMAPSVSPNTYERALLCSADETNPLAKGIEITKLVYTPANEEKGIPAAWTYVKTNGQADTWNGKGDPVVYLVYRGETFRGVTPEGVTVNLFNYSEVKNTGINVGKKLEFNLKGSPTVNIDENGWNNWTGNGGGVYQGIVHTKLPDVGNGNYGYPVLSGDVSGDDPGDVDSEQWSLDYLFDPSVTASPTVDYTNADYLFLQDEDGYYYYDSGRNFAQLDNNGDFLLYGRPSNDGEEAYFAPFDAIDTHSDNGYHFGMTVMTDFMMPHNGMVNNKPMVFEFTGDDDVWVFIDGVLILDMGGIHLAYSGSINFATGEVYVNNVNNNNKRPQTTYIYDKMLAAKGEDWVNENMVNVGTEENPQWIFKDYTMHDFQFYYLERGGGKSNCKIKFNLPTVPKNSLVVSKELTAGEKVSSQLLNFVAGELDYTFEVLKVQTDEDGKVVNGADGKPVITETVFDAEDLPTFQIMSNGQQVGTGTVNKGGTFTLKAGQSAVFNNLLAATDGYYVVRETMPANIKGQYLGADYDVVSAGGTSTETIDDIVDTTDFAQYTTDPLTTDKTTTTVVYKNKVNMKALSLLNVTKIVRPGSQIPAERDFLIKIQIDGEDLPAGTPYRLSGDSTVHTTAASDNGIIKVKDGQTISLASGILQGSVVTVYEVNDYGYTISYTGTITGGGETVDMGMVNNKISGTVVHTNSTANVTVYNADYSFAARLPISKTVLGAENNLVKAFAFTIQSLDDSKNATAESPYTMTLTTSGTVTRTETIYFGFTDETEVGTYYYRVSEVIPANLADREGITYDEHSYIVEVTVSEANGRKSAAVTEITKCDNHTAKTGTDVTDPANATLAFVNSKSGSLSLEKQVKKLGEDISANAGNFKFKLEIPGESGTASYSVYNSADKLSGSVEFKNGVAEISVKAGADGKITIKGLPAGKTVVITELKTDGYAVSWSGDLAAPSTAHGFEVQSLEIKGEAAVEVICINTTGPELPSTGGIGTHIYTTFGIVMMLGAGVLLLNQRRRKEAVSVK